ncbi:hypothetical protein CK507_09430 [Pseudomonas sp. WN033]|nr:hypothetical protein CK507_09430 [Pseudomonas sp. WN033]
MRQSTGRMDHHAAAPLVMTGGESEYLLGRILVTTSASSLSYQPTPILRHCEERSDVAIHKSAWITTRLRRSYDGAGGLDDAGFLAAKQTVRIVILL